MKAWYLSKLVWVNGLTLLAGVLGYVAGQEVIGNNAELVAMLVALQGATNIVLRFFTWKSIG